MINPLDFFDALTLIGKISVSLISGVVFVVIYFLFKTLKKSEPTEFVIDTGASFVKKEILKDDSEILKDNVTSILEEESIEDGSEIVVDDETFILEEEAKVDDLEFVVDTGASFVRKEVVEDESEIAVVTGTPLKKEVTLQDDSDIIKDDNTSIVKEEAVEDDSEVEVYDETSIVKEETVADDLEFIVDTGTSFVRKEILEDDSEILEPDIAFEEEKRKLESFGKKKPKTTKSDNELLNKIMKEQEKTPFHPEDLKPETRVLEKPKIGGTYTQYIKGPKTKKSVKKPEKEMKFSGTCDFCRRKIGGPVKSKKSRLLSYDPERVETTKYVTKELLDLPFICSYCGGTFCSEHRLPEQHECKKLNERSHA